MYSITPGEFAQLSETIGYEMAYELYREEIEVSEKDLYEYAARLARTASNSLGRTLEHWLKK